MELSRLVAVVDRVRATSRKTEKVGLLADLLREARGRSLELAALYLSGALPQGRVGVGWSRLRAVMDDRPRAGERLDLLEVDRVLDRIASEQGAGAAERRSQRLRELLTRADPTERRFLAGLILGELRQGALEGLLLEAIARASGLPARELREAAMYADDLGALARAAIDDGRTGLARFSLRVLSPVAPMLASTAQDPGEAVGRLGEAAFEYKLDGARIQLHKAGDEVRVFTRQLRDVTAAVPEVVEWARRLRVRECVLEGEAIGLRPDGRPQPFQVTMRRLGRSKDVESARARLSLSSFFFDCLYLEGDGPLTATPYAERYRRLEAAVPADALLPRLLSRDAGEVEGFLRQSLAAGHEGLMAKSLTAPYVAGQRGFHWLKLKPVRTLDLVVLAAEWGSGRRKGWLSNLHLGARDAESGGFVMLGKTFKGLTDEMLAWQTERLLALEAERDAWTVRVRPELVIEIAFGEVQESPRYPAGLALRFARVRRYRPDKAADEADTIQVVRGIFDQQRA